MAKAHIIGIEERLSYAREEHSLKAEVLKIISGLVSLDSPWIYHEHGQLSVDLPFGGRQRLHIWNPEDCPHDLDIVHSHTWRYFRSQVLAGCLKNVLYEEVPKTLTGGLRGIPHIKQLITADYQGTVYTEPEAATLTPVSAFVHGPGSSYDCHHWEIHETMPAPGTVTVIKIEGIDVPAANLYWRPTHRCTKQAPKIATEAQIRSFCAAALKNYDTF